MLAAAAGTVVGVRDGMKDISFRVIGAAAVKSRECGNGVLVRHEGGWSTQYCHMRQGSIAVKKGDGVAAGRVLGMVGNSGMAEFPHLHIQVKKGKKLVDPFLGPDPPEECGGGPNSLWKPSVVARLPYRPTAVYNIGFTDTAAKADKARNGGYRESTLPRQASALVLWADIFWVRPGDAIAFRIIGPGGKTIFAHEISSTKNLARRFAYAGRPSKGKTWAAGVYKGEVRLLRDDGAGGPQTFGATTTITVR